MGQNIPALKLPFANISGLPHSTQYQIRRDFEEVARLAQSSPTSFDAIIDPALAASDPTTHHYINLTELAINETWATTKTLNVGVVARADHIITETGVPDISGRGDLTLVGIGSPAAAGGTTPNWDWKTPIVHANQNILMRGLNINPAAVAQNIGTYSVTLFDCVVSANVSLVATQTMTAWNSILNTSGLVNAAGGIALLYNCDLALSGTVFATQTLYMVGGRCNPGGGSFTFAGIGFISAVIGASVTVNSVTTGDILIENTGPVAGGLTFSDANGSRRGVGAWTTVAMNSAGTLPRSFDGFVLNTLDVTGPAQIEASVGKANFVVSATLRGSGIQADLHIRDVYVTGLALVGCTDSMINVSFNQPSSVGRQAYTIDAASARCVLVTAGSTFTNWGTASTNAGTNCLVITELFTGGGGSVTNNIFPTAVAGEPGQDGDDGYPGPPGPAGATGPPGTAVKGVPGNDGEDGLDGFPGPPGATGATGPQGAAGFGAPGTAGVDGEDGLDGLPGPQGAVGAQGLQGAAIRGMAGEDGEDGYDGLPGPQGAPGAQGLPGAAIRGMAGEDGEDGLDGMPGPPGPSGARTYGPRTWSRYWFT